MRADEHPLGLTGEQLRPPADRVASIIRQFGADSQEMRWLAEDYLTRANKLRGEWRRYAKRHDTTRPPLTPNLEQLPHYDFDGDLQLSLI